LHGVRKGVLGLSPLYAQVIRSVDRTPAKLSQESERMAQHPIWRGNLRLALVSCPIALYTAHHDRGDLHFNLINPKTGNRVKMVAQDAETGQTLQRSDLVKGYEYAKGEYVVLDDEDFESAKIDSSSNLKIEKFVDAETIDPIYYEGSYYVAPDGASAEDVYLVLRDAIADSGKAALSHVVIARREHPVAILPMANGLILHTLRQRRELNDFADLFDHLPKSKPDPEMVQLAIQLIDRQSGRYEPADIEDRYEARLRAVIDAKVKGKGLEPEAEAPTDRSNVVDLVSALRNSLKQGGEPSSAGKTRSGAKSAPGRTKQIPKKAATKPAARRRA
jgi:DNA end-binding protein Ku